jgi:flagellar assembly protein FliH
LPDDALSGTTPYAYADFRSSTVIAAPVEYRTFEVSATAAVPDALLSAARSEATAAGFASGWAHGVREAQAAMAADVHQSQLLAQRLDAERSERARTAFAALDRAAAGLALSSAEVNDELEDTVLRLGIDLAEALMQRELRLSGSVSRDALARVLRFTADDAPVTVRMSIADYETLSAEQAPARPGARVITLEADETLSPGDAVAVCGVTRVDGRLSEGLARARAVLAS